MSDRAFFDTNILLYAYDREAGEKRTDARELLRSAHRIPAASVISVQVLQEFHVNFLRSGGSPDELAPLVNDFARWKVVDNSLPLYRLGAALQQRWQLSLWDAMILAAAQASKATILYSEDFSHRQDYGGVQVINPFTSTNA